MNLISKYYKLLTGIFIFLFAIYIIPNFITLNSYKSYIEKEIETVIGFDIDIKGEISFTILPRPSIILRNVDVKSKSKIEKNETFLSAKQVFVNTNIISFFEKKTVIDKIGIIDAKANAKTYKDSAYENMDILLNGKTFKEIIVKNGTVELENSSITEINTVFKSLKNEKLEIIGSLKYKDGQIDNFDGILSYLNKQNYNIVSKFDYSTYDSDFYNEFTFVVKDGEPILSGTTELDTDNITNFVKVFKSDFSLPNTKFFNSDLKIKTNIQTTPDSILFSNGIIQSDYAFANFKGTIPFSKDIEELNKYTILNDKIKFDIDFKNLSLNNFINLKSKPKSRSFMYPFLAINDSRNILGLLQNSNFNITADNIVLPTGVATHFEVSTSPIVTDGVKEGVNIKKFQYRISKNLMDLNGKITNITSGDLLVDLNVNTSIPMLIDNIFSNKVYLDYLNASVKMSQDKLLINNIDADIAGGTFTGNFEYERINKISYYDMDIKSDYLNMDAITKNKNLDLSFIISTLSKLKNVNFSLITDIKELEVNKTIYNYFDMNTMFKNNNLILDYLSFNEGSYKNEMNGNLNDIVGKKGSFDNFNYIIYSKKLAGVKIPFIKNTFIDRMVEGGLNKLNINLNGDANNPMANVSANLNDITVDINGYLFDTDASYKVNLSHNELKGFLFSWGFIDESLTGYFYDNIPFELSADIQKDSVKNLIITIKNNIITGEIANIQTTPSVSFKSDDFDIKGIIKRIKATDGYLDLLLKLIRSTWYNLYFDIPIVNDYDDNNYQDFILDVTNQNNPGFITLDLKKDDYSISLNSEIINKRIFEGSMEMKNYKLPSDIMENELLNIMSGKLSGKVDFKTNGDNYYEILSNLNAPFSIDINDGKIQGISDYQTFLINILKLANITTNNVLYSIENSLKSGILKFDTLKIDGEISNSNIKDAAFNIAAPNILISGIVSGNLIQKNIDISSVFEVKELSNETLKFMYNLTGFVNNLTGKVDTTPLISKINTVYLQKKKKEILQ